MKRTMVVVWLALVALLASCARTPAPEVLEEGGLEATAATELFFSEYVEGSSFNKALEIYNGTGAAVDLSAYRVELYSNGSATPSQSLALSGTLANDDVYVLAHPSAAFAATADVTSSTVVNFNGDDAVALRKGGVTGNVIDVIGQIGTDPGAEWGTGLTSTQDNTIRRKASVCVGDANGSDAFDPSAEWDGFANDTFDGLGSHAATCGGPVEDVAPTVSSTDPAADATGVALDSNITVTFSEAVTVADGGFGVTCTVSGALSGFSSTDDTTFTLDPSENFAEEETCTVTVTAANVTDQDADDPPDNMAADYTFIFTTRGAPTLISAVQGSGNESPLAGQTVTVEGVVVADFEGGSPNLGGFYVQEEEGDWDNDPATSEGIFVFNSTRDSVNVGDNVSVTGRVSEFSGQTQITPSDIEILTSTASVAPTPVTMPFPADVNGVPYLERFEGMLVVFPDALVISEYFNYDRFGEIVLANPINEWDRHYTPTAVVEPGPAATALYQEYLLNRITLDDASTAQNPSFTRHPNGEAFSLSNRFRGGDTLTNTTGILAYAFNLYRIQPTEGADYEERNPRPENHDPVGGSLEVASFNVLNYFTDFGDACGPSGSDECRGADNGAELERQRAKILAALTAIEADIFGLIEIENSADGSGEADLVAGLNETFGAGTYDYIETGPIGTDAIKVALVYKPSAVTPLGDYAVLDSSDDPRFLDGKNRPVLAQTFMNNATGARFTVAVNHFKSKGSDCDDVGDPDMNDGQSNCNETRTRAAEALADWLAGDPTGQGERDALIVGDLNAYDKEDPIDALRAAGYTDLLFEYEGEFAYTYVFDGQFGYLDYALSSATLTEQVTGATAWHINADEPDLLDYDTSFKSDAQDAIYAPDPYRSSDHDPVIVGLEPTYTRAETLAALRYFIAQYASDGSLSRGQENALLKKLEQLERSLARGQTRVALNQLRAFEDQVRDLTESGVLSAVEGERLLILAGILRDQL